MSWRGLAILLLALLTFAVACADSSGRDDAAPSDARVESAIDEVAPAAETASTADIPSAPDEPTDSIGEPENDVASSTDEPVTPTPAPAPTSTPAAPVEPVSYDGSFSSTIQPIFEEKCASCHYDGGPGAFHWNLRSAQDVVDTHLLVENVITSKYMPPWPAGDLSVALQGDRSLTPQQIQAIVDWVGDGAAIDVEPSAAIAPIDGVIKLENPDIIVGPAAPYAGDPSIRDDHRCLVYELPFDDGAWITGYEFLPDQTEVVHHAVGFLMSKSNRASVDARDGVDGQPGWRCAGSVGLSGGEPLVLWAPGQAPTILAEGTGRWVAPGSFIVMQMHYHFETQAPLDSSTLALTIDPPDADLEKIRTFSIAAPAEIPCAEWEVGPLCDRDAAVADAVARFGKSGALADAINRICGVTQADFEQFTKGVAQSSCSSPGRSFGHNSEIQAVLLHMHELGTWTRLTLNKGDADELIVVDIPKWDFDWQASYVPADPIIIQPDDTVTLECGWDRSLRSAELDPAWVLWAEGTNDEMCQTFLIVR